MSAELVVMASDVNGVALGVLIALFPLVTVLGFMASRFQRTTTSTPSTSGDSVVGSSGPG